MAFLQVHFYSECLKRNVPMNVILPIEEKQGKEQMDSKLKTLYLLHGITDDHNAWISNTGIQRWAEEKNLAVVMPCGNNSFFVDLELPDNRYGEFIGREIVALTRRMFPLSNRKEDTFIAGLSMGGFGALRNGLKYYDTFGYIAGLSSALHIFELPVGHPERGMFSEEDSVMGDLEQAAKTDKNPRIAVKNIIKEIEDNTDKKFPHIYMACGLQDRMITVNRLFRDFLQENGVPLTYIEEKGEHNWDFWNAQIQNVLEWLPL